MTKLNGYILKFPVPILAFVIVSVQMFFVNTINLTRWKGGGFGMYSEMHYHYNEVVVSNLDTPLDSLKTSDSNIAKAVNRLKRIPSTANLKKTAFLLSENMTKGNLTVQVWKPLINSKNGSYSRELLNEFRYLKP